jgi:predicted flap endonuclease-1-like 5' DNA nuclease
MEELEELEPLDDGEISAMSPAPPRTSVPPPIPKQALEQRVSQVGMRPSPVLEGHGSVPPPLRPSMPASQRSSLPPAPPPAGAGPQSAPPSSGVYRLPENKSEADRWNDVVRELELKVRLRDDLISELKRSLEEHKKIALTADARVNAAEARASAAEARASDAEARTADAETRATTAATHAPVVSADDLKRIKGIGPAFERKLHSLGVSSYAVIANWGEADIERIAEALAILPQRITRDGWIENARKLSKA